MTKQMIHLLTTKLIFSLRDEKIDLLVHKYPKYVNVYRIKLNTKLEMLSQKRKEYLWYEMTKNMNLSICLINLQKRSFYHLTHKALFLHFLRAFLTLFLDSWLHPKNGSNESQFNSQVVILKAWHHQCIMLIFSSFMMTPWTAAPQEILGKSVEQNLNAIPNKHLVGYIKAVLWNDYPQTSNCSYNFSRTNLAFRL